MAGFCQCRCPLSAWTFVLSMRACPLATAPCVAACVLGGAQLISNVLTGLDVTIEQSAGVYEWFNSNRFREEVGIADEAMEETVLKECLRVRNLPQHISLRDFIPLPLLHPCCSTPSLRWTSAGLSSLLHSSHAPALAPAGGNLVAHPPRRLAAGGACVTASVAFPSLHAVCAVRSVRAVAGVDDQRGRPPFTEAHERRCQGRCRCDSPLSSCLRLWCAHNKCHDHGRILCLLAVCGRAWVAWVAWVVP